MIELKQVTFQYDNAPENAHSIRNINLTIQNGECVVLCGRSGCGKTTITRLINGLIPHYYEGVLSGYVSVDGAEIKKQKLSKISQHVGSVFQNPRSQFFNVDTTSELAFGCENQGLPKEDVLERIADAANHFCLNGLLNRSIFELSGGEKQRIACASVYAVHPDIFVLDEPSSNLDPASIQQLKDVLLKLKAEGKTLVISEHRLYYLLDIADRFIWLDQGEVRSVYTREEILAFSPAQISAMGLRALDLKQVESEAVHLKHPEHEFTFQKLECKVSGHSVLHIKSLQIPAGEIVAVIGHNGAGKSTTIKMLTGIMKPTDGKISVMGNDPFRERIRNAGNLGVVFGQKTQLWWDISVKDSFELLHSIYEIPDNVYEENLNLFKEILELEEFIDQPARKLSLGQRVRADIAAALLHDPPVLFLDEPTIGLDVAVKQKVYQFLQYINKEKKTTILLTSHDLKDMEWLCRRLIILEKGEILFDDEITKIFDNYPEAETLEEIIIELFNGNTEN